YPKVVGRSCGCYVIHLQRCHLCGTGFAMEYLGPVGGSGGHVVRYIYTSCACCELWINFASSGAILCAAGNALWNGMAGRPAAAGEKIANYLAPLLAYLYNRSHEARNRVCRAGGMC